MPRGTALSTLLVMLKAEIGDNATGNTVRDAQLRQLLANKQQLLAATYPWAFLERKWDVAVPAAGRYAVLPTTTATGSDFAETNVLINMEHPITVDVRYGTVWQPVDYGIGPDELTFLDSDNDDTHSVILRWRWATNANDSTPAVANRFEVWPVPSIEQMVRFTGQRKLKALVVDADTADLDDLMLVDFVAADRFLFAGQTEMAKLKLASAQERMRTIRASYPERQELLIMGQTQTQGNAWDSRRDRKVIAIA